MSDYVKTWMCPNCGVSEDADDMFVPETDTGSYTCDHCIQHGWGENQMKPIEYKNDD